MPECLYIGHVSIVESWSASLLDLAVANNSLAVLDLPRKKVPYTWTATRMNSFSDKEHTALHQNAYPSGNRRSILGSSDFSASTLKLEPGVEHSCDSYAQADYDRWSCASTVSFTSAVFWC